MMEEQNQEKATATQHVKAADAAAPETGNGKKEDKGGGKKEKKTAKPLTPKQLQQRKKLMVYPLMGLLFLGSMWLIFAPSEKREVNRDTVGAFNADIPLPENDGIIGDKRKAYEQAQKDVSGLDKQPEMEDNGNVPVQIEHADDYGINNQNARNDDMVTYRRVQGGRSIYDIATEIF